MSIIVKNTTLPNPLELLAPHSCRGCGRLGTLLCDCCKNYIINRETNICPICKNKTSHGKCRKHASFPVNYNLGERSELLDLLIHDYKYHSVRALSGILAELVNDVLPKLPSDAILVPLPTATHHIRERGFDHTWLMAKKLARLQRIKVRPVLLREKNTVQVGADRKARLNQAEHAYSINPKMTIDSEVTYILFDDIWTTGASMKTAIKKLRQAGAIKIIVILLAISRLEN
ncbi:ComF family protein [Candidatus Saccharibacteria bacterium]|nr:ComF family protein [Candidatus Saccharibacteria bacterium]